MIVFWGVFLMFLVAVVPAVLVARAARRKMDKAEER
jgi:hypothetical protein